MSKYIAVRIALDWADSLRKCKENGSFLSGTGCGDLADVLQLNAESVERLHETLTAVDKWLIDARADRVEAPYELETQIRAALAK